MKKNESKNVAYALCIISYIMAFACVFAAAALMPVSLELSVLLWFVAIILSIVSLWGMYRRLKRKKLETSLREKKDLLENDYNDTKKAALKTPKERYTVDLGMISFVMGLAQGLAMNDVQTGIEMQNTDAPQADWAIAGGLASGVAGGFAGVGAAIDTINQNAEATKCQHKRGRDLVEQGMKNYQRLEDDKKAVMSESYDDFTYGVRDSKLISKLKVELYSAESYGIGYMCAKVKISAGRNYDFPGTNKKAVIDGSVRVDLYDKGGIKLLASGYYCPPGRYGNDKTKTGFGLDGCKTITLKEEEGVSFDKNDGYQIKLSDPNLWLLQL